MSQPNNDRQVRIRAADTLLGRGVRVATVYPSVYFDNAELPNSVDLVIYQPTLGELIEISGYVERMGLDADRLQNINLTDSYFLVNNTAYLAVEALFVVLHLSHPRVTREQWMELIIATIYPHEFRAAWELLLLHSGVADFTLSTGLIQSMSNLNPLT